ncbi:Transcriptional regulator, LacI family [Sodalis praecaptivus]|uniref:Transcriptional regulator, LacI family n=1 Tax=Sodalis praecaptivus TaxID=1239307 RepID=W0HQM8_9GAMM|nr:LacI family DNA-binding transcriptional regulator [Sodalis praecaptivus]AHF76099.1 Transcriptional regulator, LacI family [Sodalis praecaptivus]
MDKKVAISDVAQAAGVSTATISRYLNGKFGSMSVATRERIGRVIAEMNYKPNDVARSLRSTQSKTIAVIMADIFNPYSMDILKGIEGVCTPFGYTLFLCDAKDDAQNEIAIIENMMSKRVDGFIINSTGKNDRFIRTVAQEIPTVLVGRKLGFEDMNCVSVDNRQGMQLAMAHLRQRHCDAVTLFTPPPDTISPRIERVDAFNAIGESEAFKGVPCRTVIVENETVDTLGEHIAQAVNGAATPGIISINGKLSLSMVKAMHRAGLAFPRDLLFIGFDDTEWASVIATPLTVIAQPTYDIGAGAASKLIAVLTKEKSIADSGQTRLPVTLIERQSTIRK